ncbi:MAG: pyridoxal phosphate-dependent aminotransferase family protein [Clostridia bacterium]|nr:pyridoxal phosphate-dependent aminotransferase family protein [Clostridia bacterium]
MDIFQKCYDFTKADEYKKLGLYHYFHALESRQDTTVIMEGKRRIMLGSNNYLGLTVHPEVIEAGVKAYEKYGSGCSGSRFLNGTLQLHLELEKELAEFLGKDGIVTFSTGFQSNLGIISAIVGHGDYAICDAENHASIYDGCKLSYGRMLTYPHADMEALEAQLAKIGDKGGKLIITDGIFSMGGDICKLPEICALAEKYGARVMVDDSHALGVIGKGGRGTASHFGLEDKVDIIMGTFSKSLASLGGFMAASERVVNYVMHNSRPYIFSASMPPANCAAALTALRIIKREPERISRLADLSAYARQGFKKRNIPIIEARTPIIPVYTYEAENTLIKAAELYHEGVFVNPVLPPATQPGNCLLRTSYMATLTYELIDEALDIFDKVFNK